ncbi:lysoplasmalogenase [Undibacterium sp. Jales W-56]|uniref:lysoplasmalogenase n=1 Tax=Undibacterium sp. Jales W-56 TaxID=2897325 RepID=UPI0021D3A697|nr:lysoplasmalogenase [Undibacterium sp. Jales W-56]MCU6432190.1 lysoplasmalogenase [Undibacterium sp. Jales W-56]
MLPFLIIISAALAIAGAGAQDSAIWLHYVCKPLTTLLIFWLAYRASNFTPPYRTAILTGIVLSLFGDIFLMLPVTLLKSGFLLGLGSFLCAHLCFLRALTSDTRWFSRPLIFLMVGLLGAFNLSVLWLGLAADLRIPVVVYVACLLCMTSQAISRHLSLQTTASKLAMCGGVIFMLSDTLLAYNQFYTPLPQASLLILATYYAALSQLARSVNIA